MTTLFIHTGHEKSKTPLPTKVDTEKFMKGKKMFFE
jgi:hypothetical protein